MKILLLSLCLIAGTPALSEKGFGSEAPSQKTTRTFSLDGKWDITGFGPDRSGHVTLEGTVPGQVHADLQLAGFIPDPFWRDNAELCQWPEYWEWRYKKVFDLPENFINDWVALQFDGLDTFADITVNGKKIGPPGTTTTNDMFLPYEFDVSSGWLKPVGNVIEVRFYPHAKIVGEQAKKKPLPGAFADPLRPYVRRMQCTFGWDWVNRFVTAGIWKSCRIVSYPNARIDDLFIYTKKLSENAVLRQQVRTAVFEKGSLRTGKASKAKANSRISAFG